MAGERYVIGKAREREREKGGIMIGRVEKELKKQIQIDKERIGKEKGRERECDIFCR